jgi:hypothetical protein
MELKKRLYMRRKINEMTPDNTLKYKKQNRTQDEIRLYNRLYYALVLRNSAYYKHYAKEYHSKHKDVYKYKYKQATIENMNNKRKIKIVQMRVKIEEPTEENKFIIEI